VSGLSAKQPQRVPGRLVQFAGEIFDAILHPRGSSRPYPGSPGEAR
jgi:hypothetical protein